MRFARIALVLLLAGCDLLHVGLDVTNAPAPRECIPGSATKPCS